MCWLKIKTARSSQFQIFDAFPNYLVFPKLRRTLKLPKICKCKFKRDNVIRWEREDSDNQARYFAKNAWHHWRQYKRWTKLNKTDTHHYIPMHSPSEESSKPLSQVCCSSYGNCVEELVEETSADSVYQQECD